MKLKKIKANNFFNMQGVSYVLPILNEEIINVEKVIRAINVFCNDKILNFEILLFDGGSKSQKLLELLKLCKDDNYVKLYLDYPLLRPNKDVAIKNAAKLCQFENVIISDVDIININENHFQIIYKELLNQYNVVIPDLERKGGRWNRILANPFMRVCFADVYRKIPYPAPGIMGIKRNLVKKVIKEDFFMDWGGEIQIPVILGIESNKISTPKMNKVDSKKRSVKNIINDAYQVWRTNLFLLNSFNRTIEINNHYQKYQEEYDLFKQFCANFSPRVKKILFNSLVFFEKEYNGDINNIYKIIREIADETGQYEFHLINYLVVIPLSQLLFDIHIDYQIVEKSQKEIIELDILKVSFFVDFVFYFFASKCTRLKKFKSFEYSLECLPAQYTEHNSYMYYSAKYNNVIELNGFSENVISQVGEICSTRNKNERLDKIDEYFLDLIGEIEGEQIKYSSLGLFKNTEIIDESDLLIKTSILTTIAGYKKKNQITVSSRNEKKIELDSFLSYVLNNKSFAPVSYDLKYRFSGMGRQIVNEANEFDCVVLFSGGLDSTAATLLALERGLKPLLLWVGFGQKNQKSEEKAVKYLSQKLNTRLFTFYIDLSKYIEEGWKEWDYIIPARNFIFVTIAGSILSQSKNNKCTILLSAHEEELKDTNTDKSLRFFNTCSEILSLHHNKDIHVTTPFAKSTKSEIISYWSSNWSMKYQITPHDTITCFYGNNCGECKACYKRNLAFLAAGIEMDDNLKKSILKDESYFIRDYFLKEISLFPEKRKREYELAFIQNKTLFPHEVYAYVDDLCPEDIIKIEERKIEIQTKNILKSSWI